MLTNALRRAVPPPSSDPLPRGRRAMLEAVASGAATTFSLTHNPLFQALIVPGIITFIAGPFLGGMMAAGKARLDALGIVLVSLAIGVADAGPFALAWGLVWTLVASNPNLMPDQASLGRILTGLGWFIGGVAVYAVVTAWAGTLYGIRVRR